MAVILLFKTKLALQIVKLCSRLGQILWKTGFDGFFPCVSSATGVNINFEATPKLIRQWEHASDAHRKRKFYLKTPQRLCSVKPLHKLFLISNLFNVDQNAMIFIWR